MDSGFSVIFNTDDQRGLLRLGWHEDGGFTILRADQEALIDEKFLQVVVDESLKTEGIRYGDGILTITGRNGMVSYGVGEPVAGTHVRRMQRSSAPPATASADDQTWP